jgi:hypothetical protein
VTQKIKKKIDSAEGWDEKIYVLSCGKSRKIHCRAKTWEFGIEANS